MMESNAVSAEVKVSKGTSCPVEKVENESASRKEEGKKAMTQSNKRSKIVIEIVALSISIMVIEVFLVLPIVFYALRDVEPPTPMNNTTTNTSNVNGECSASFPYPTAGGVCRDELEGILLSMECDSGGTPLVLHDEESTARQLTAGFITFLNPSPECEEAVVLFLCLFLFGLCDSSGVSLQPTSGQCEHLRDGVCRTEWSTALSFGLDLPDCNSFPAEQVSCPDQSGSGSGINSTAARQNRTESTAPPLNSTEMVTNTPALLPCRENFYREEGSDFCLPSCATWREISPGKLITIDVVTLLANVIGFITGLAAIVLSLISFKRMFRFPFVFLVIMNFDVVIAVFFGIIIFFGRQFLFCATPNLLDSFTLSTPFCVISGIVTSYAILQATLSWLFYTTALFWVVVFPLQARSHQNSSKLKYTYVACFIAAIAIPVVPIIVSMASFAVRVKTNPILLSGGVTFASGGLGYINPRFPNFLGCTSSNIDVFFFTLLLPSTIMFMIGIAEMVVIFWKILKVSVKKAKRSIRICTPERKIFVVLLYYIFFGVFALISFTLSLRNDVLAYVQLFNYFTCEMRGHDLDMPCDRNTFSEFSNAHPELTATMITLLGFFPAVSLVFILNVKELKEKSKTCCSC